MGEYKFKALGNVVILGLLLACLIFTPSVGAQGNPEEEGVNEVSFCTDEGETKVIELSPAEEPVVFPKYDERLGVVWDRYVTEAGDVFTAYEADWLSIGTGREDIWVRYDAERGVTWTHIGRTAPDGVRVIVHYDELGKPSTVEIEEPSEGFAALGTWNIFHSEQWLCDEDGYMLTLVEAFQECEWDGTNILNCSGGAGRFKWHEDWECTYMTHGDGGPPLPNPWHSWIATGDFEYHTGEWQHTHHVTNYAWYDGHSSGDFHFYGSGPPGSYTTQQSWTS